MNQFSVSDARKWLVLNGLSESRIMFETTLERLAVYSKSGSREIPDIWIHTRSEADWIGGALAGLCLKVRVWFVPVVWTASSVHAIGTTVCPDWILTDAGWSSYPFGKYSACDDRSNLPFESGLLIPTGGSSGRTKFAFHRLHSLHAAVLGVSRHFLKRDPLEGDFNYCGGLPLWHVSGWMQVIRSYLTNSRYFLADKGALEWAQMEKCRWLSVVPTQLRRMMDDLSKRSILEHADFLIVGGGACPTDILLRCSEIGIFPWVTYGMTETLGMIAGKTIRCDQDLEVAAEVFNHARIGILDESGMLRFDNEPGEIVVECDALCSGYWSMEGSASHFSALQSPLRTRDFGSLESGGGLHVLGRMDDLIISGGEKVNPREVETVVRQTPEIQDCVVTSIPDADWGSRIVCLYTTSLNDELNVDGIKLQIKSRLESYKIPKSWKRVKSLPFDEKGKLKKTELEHLVAELFAN